jgi:transposase
MDNLPAHRIAGVREAIEAAGASLLYLPPYSPDLHAIEQAFAKLKALLRKAATAQSPPCGTASARFSAPSLRPNALITSATLAMLQPDRNLLLSARRR